MKASLLVTIGCLFPAVVSGFLISSSRHPFGISRSVVDREPDPSPFCRLSATKRDSSSGQSSKRKRRRTNAKRPKSSNIKRNRNEESGFVGPLTLRVFGVEVHPDRLPSGVHSSPKKIHPKEEGTLEQLPAEKRAINTAVVDSLLKRLRIARNVDDSDDDGKAPLEHGCWQQLLANTGIADLRVVRRSLDARQKQRSDGGTGPRFMYVVDVDIAAGRRIRGKHQPGRLEARTTIAAATTKTTSPLPTDETNCSEAMMVESKKNACPTKKKRVIIVGAGPAGLFCALQLARSGVVHPILLERGQAVEARGKDIGALMHRRSMDSESNFAFGEGGAGTWSDGKLTTRIGRNSEAVRFVLETLVEYGAPDTILVEGAPHLGTDNLVRLLRKMRQDLHRLGGEIHFGTKVNNLIIQNGIAQGVDYETQKAVERNIDAVSVTPGGETGTMLGDAVVLATGHSARDVYENLHKSGVQLEPKGFAVGFRVEHPQWLINNIQYGSEWGPAVVTGKKKTDQANQRHAALFSSPEATAVRHQGRLPVPSYRLAVDNAFDGRGVYSFCMCPGGQIVPASTDPQEVCVNGMSFSRRDSLWANSALVVTVSPDDAILDPYREKHGVLAGVAFQRDMEQRASIMGGGNLTVPVQRVTDFIAGRPSTTAPSSSYRLGVRPSACHELYPLALVKSLRTALTDHFEKKMPGFVCEDGLLHGVETRTSSPVRVSRDEESLQSIGAKRLFPAGEGAGFAGGIVSAAVDGMATAEAVLDALFRGAERRRGKEETWKSSKGVGTFY